MKEFEPVKVEPCKNCGFPMRQYNPNSMMMVCESCGTRTGDNEEAPRYKPEVPNNPLFKLHAFFEMQGITWQVIGCQSYSGVVDEWDKEDNAWEHTPWNFHTWWVINEARELAWIVQDKTGYSWSRKTKITSGIPEGDISYEVGHWSLLSAVGEFSYRPAEDEQVLTYEKDNKSLEILLDENGKNKEIEAFQAVKIDPTDLLQGFGKSDVISALNRSKLAVKFAIATVVSLVLGFFMMQTLEQELLTVPTTQITSQSLKKAIDLGTFTLDKKGLVEFSIAGTIGRGVGSFDADLVVKDSDKSIVAEVPISLWRESGRDSDGPWTESQTRDAPRIALPAGDRYQLSMMPDTLKNWSQVTLRGTITKNVVSLLPIIIGGISAVLLAFYIMRVRRKRIRKETGI